MGRPKTDYMNSIIENYKRVAVEMKLDMSPIEGLTDKSEIAKKLRDMLNKARDRDKSDLI